MPFEGGNGLARSCRSWREGRESQRWPGSGSGGNGGNGSRDNSRSERRAGRGRWNLLEEETRSSSSRSSSSSSCSRWWKARGAPLATGRSVDGVTVGPDHYPRQDRPHPSDVLRFARGCITSPSPLHTTRHPYPPSTGARAIGISARQAP